MYTNYSHFIERAQVRIFHRDQSLRADPLAVAEVDRHGFARWRPEPASFAAPVNELKFVLRAYDAEGRFDETAPQVLWMIHGQPAEDAPAESGEGDQQPRDTALQDQYGGLLVTGQVRRSPPLQGSICFLYDPLLDQGSNDL